MGSEGASRCVALRIDVDFAVGLREAVPLFLDALADAGMRATFFVVAGRNDPRRSLARLARPGYWRRLRRLGLGRILLRLGGALARGETFLESDSARRSLRRIIDEGHEIAVHGHDHAWWADNAWSASGPRLVEEIERAYRAMEAATGSGGQAWGSPSWRTTEGVLRHLRGRGVPYFSDCWGRGPFRTVDERGESIPVPHLPITLPSLETLVLERGLDPAIAARSIVDGARPGSVDVLCVHDYFEGLLRPALFPTLVAAFRRAGVRTCALREAARSLVRADAVLPSSRLTRAPLPGFTGDVSWQA